MGDFGHFWHNSDELCIDAWGAGPFVIEVGDKRYTFEDSDRFGPLLVRKNGSPLDNQPGERHPFWIGYNPWRRQGRRVADGLCVWQPFKPDKVRIIVRGRKRFGEVVEQGDCPFGSIEVVETVRLPTPSKD